MASQGEVREMPFLVGVDGGQTSTKALLSRLDGEILARGKGGPSVGYHTQQDIVKNRDAIHGAILSAFESAAVRLENVTAVGLGLTGVGAHSASAGIVEEIVREILEPGHVVVTPDHTTNLAGASGGKPGVVVIAGGGSIAYGITNDGEEAVAGGFAYRVRDEGSAYDIGHQAIIAAARASDGRDPPTCLEAILKDEFEVETVRQIKKVLYGDAFSRELVASLAPRVAQAAQAGDRKAIEIMRDAGHELARCALAVMRRLYPPDRGVDVYLTGGVFNAGESVERPFRDLMRLAWPRASVRLPRFPPVVGSLILARRACNLPVDASWLATVDESLTV